MVERTCSKVSPASSSMLSISSSFSIWNAGEISWFEVRSSTATKEVHWVSTLYLVLSSISFTLFALCNRACLTPSMSYTPCYQSAIFKDEIRSGKNKIKTVIGRIDDGNSKRYTSSQSRIRARAANL